MMRNEYVFNTDGALLCVQPYIFRRLWKIGQMYIQDSITYKVMACNECDGNVYTTVKKISGEKKE